MKQCLEMTEVQRLKIITKRAQKEFDLSYEDILDYLYERAECGFSYALVGCDDLSSQCLQCLKNNGFNVFIYENNYVISWEDIWI